MKRHINKLLTITIIATLVLVLINCKDDENPSSSPAQDSELIGNWELAEVYVPIADSTVYPQDLGFSLTANFMADGKYEITDTETGGTPEIETGTWSTTDGTLALKNSDDGLVENIPYTVEGNVGILKVNYEVSPGFEVPAEFKFMKL